MLLSQIKLLKIFNTVKYDFLVCVWSFLLILQFDNMITHHLKLWLVSLGYKLFIYISLFNILFNFFFFLFEFFFHFCYFLFPFVFFLNHLKARSLTHFIHWMQLLSELINNSKIILLKYINLLFSTLIWVDELIKRQYLILIRLLLYFVFYVIL